MQLRSRSQDQPESTTSRRLPETAHRPPPPAGLEEVERVRLRSDEVRMNDNLIKTKGTIAAEIALLTGNCAGPEGVKIRLGDWVRCWAAGDVQAEDMEAMKTTVTDLSILAHANAAYRLIPQPRFTTVPPTVEIDDQGGYCFARLLITDIIRALPWCEGCKRELARHCLVKMDAHIAQVRDRMLRDVGI